MDEKPTYRPYLLSTLLMTIGGWGGLAFLLTAADPTIWPRWGFFALLVIALTGTALPASWYGNRIFPTTPPVESSVILREALWVGVYGSLLAWLQLGRILTFSIGLWLAVGLLLLEYLLRLRQNTRPPQP